MNYRSIILSAVLLFALSNCKTPSKDKESGEISAPEDVIIRNVLADKGAELIGAGNSKIAGVEINIPANSLDKDNEVTLKTAKSVISSYSAKELGVSGINLESVSTAISLSSKEDVKLNKKIEITLPIKVNRVSTVHSKKTFLNIVFKTQHGKNVFRGILTDINYVNGFVRFKTNELGLYEAILSDKEINKSTRLSNGTKKSIQINNDTKKPLFNVIGLWAAIECRKIKRGSSVVPIFYKLSHYNGTLDFSKEHVTFTLNYFKTAKCKSSDTSVKITGKYKLNKAKNHYNIDMLYDESSIIIRNDKLISFVNNINHCRNNDWKINIYKKVNLEYCAYDSIHFYELNPIYQIVKKVGEKLVLGNATGTYPAQSSEDRPVSFSTDDKGMQRIK